jgi:hypothetical protein
MVYEKKRSGDPDYDDKVPAAEHNAVQTAPDGTKYRTFPDQGPTTLDGEHFNLADHDKADLAGDNRPKPGEVATEASSVQSYDPASAPHVDVEPQEQDEADSGAASPVPDETPASAPAKKAATPAKRTGSAK